MFHFQKHKISLHSYYSYLLFRLTAAARAPGTRQQHSRLVKDLLKFLHVQGISPASVDDSILISFVMEAHRLGKPFSYVRLVSKKFFLIKNSFHAFGSVNRFSKDHCRIYVFTESI